MDELILEILLYFLLHIPSTLWMVPVHVSLCFMRVCRSRERVYWLSILFNIYIRQCHTFASAKGGEKVRGKDQTGEQTQRSFYTGTLRSLPDNMNWHKVVPFLLVDSTQGLQADSADRICDPWAQNRYQMFPLLRLTAKSFTLRYKDSNGSKQKEA